LLGNRTPGGFATLFLAPLGEVIMHEELVIVFVIRSGEEPGLSSLIAGLLQQPDTPVRRISSTQLSAPFSFLERRTFPFRTRTDRKQVDDER
jgi:hypothetical protein